MEKLKAYVKPETKVILVDTASFLAESNEDEYIEEKLPWVDPEEAD